MEPKELFKAEGKLITNFYRENFIRARVDWANSFIVKTGYFRFSLELDPRERFSNIEGSQRELQTVLATYRRNQGIKTIRGNKVIPFTIMPSTYPTMAIETPHPLPVPLVGSANLIFTGSPHTMSLGRSYLGEVNEEVGDLTESPHYLVCGITSAGKSVLLQNMIISLAARTSHEELKFCFIDLKNEDLVPFSKLPHTLDFAGDSERAMQVLRFVEAEKDKRIADPGYKPYRLVLVIDEMAHLANQRDANDILGKLASIGRSKWINLIGATQHPTREGGMGALLKANFTEREVGQVAPGQSQYATNRPGTHAELLPGYGSFLRCVGPTVYRFQGYYLTPDDVTSLVKRVAALHNFQHRGLVIAQATDGYLPVTDGYNNRLQPVITGNNGYSTREDIYQQAITVTENFFPIDSGRPLNEQESRLLRKLVQDGKFDHNGKPSITAMCFHVFGSKNMERVQWIKNALG